jgi:NAD(P)H-dependent FMN reductase
MLLLPIIEDQEHQMSTVTSPDITDTVTSGEQLRIAVIVASNREGRKGPTVAHWFVDRAVAATSHEIDLVDLGAFDFPSTFTMGDHPAVTEFTSRLARADAFVVVTPEYNRSFPASLKEAIDYGGAEWHAKPVGFVSYGGTSRGMIAADHLRGVFAELHAVTVRDTVSFNLFDGSADFDSAGFDSAHRDHVGESRRP